MGRFFASTTTDRQVLIGRIVTMNKRGTVHQRGALCIDGDRIAAVVANPAALPPEFAAVTPVETGATIYPGLIELHNHLSYNFLPLWRVPRAYTNRNQWRTTEPDYDASISIPAKVIGSNVDEDYARSIARFVECRSLLGGTTTTQGLSSSGNGGRKWYQGLTRNVEAPRDPAFPAAGGQTLDFSPEQIGSVLVPELQKDRPYFYHLSEGTDADARQRFLDLEYVSGSWAIDEDLITIHCTGLEAADFGQLRGAAGMVWSPLSNFLLYGTTARIGDAKAAGMRIALGSDWSPSGSKNLLGELKVARAASDHAGGVFSSAELVRMVTATPAEMLGWEGNVGSLARGKKADLLLIEGDTGDSYDHLIDATESNVLAVVIDGGPRHGRLGFLDFDAHRQERVIIGGQDYSLDLTEPGSDPLAGLSLATAIAKLIYGLAHLPELAAAMPVPGSSAFSFAAPSTRSIDFEFEEEDGDLERLHAIVKAAAPELRPLPMSAITAVDDPEFKPAMRANNNLPDFIKDIF